MQRHVAAVHIAALERPRPSADQVYQLPDHVVYERLAFLRDTRIKVVFVIGGAEKKIVEWVHPGRSHVPVDVSEHDEESHTQGKKKHRHVLPPADRVSVLVLGLW